MTAGPKSTSRPGTALKSALRHSALAERSYGTTAPPHCLWFGASIRNLRLRSRFVQFATSVRASLRGDYRDCVADCPARSDGTCLFARARHSAGGGVAIQRRPRFLQRLPELCALVIGGRRPGGAASHRPAGIEPTLAGRTPFAGRLSPSPRLSLSRPTLTRDFLTM